MLNFKIPIIVFFFFFYEVLFGSSSSLSGHFIIYCSLVIHSISSYVYEHKHILYSVYDWLFQYVKSSQVGLHFLMFGWFLFFIWCDLFLIRFMIFFLNDGLMLIGTCKFFEEKHRFFQGVFAFVFNESLKHYLTKIICFF